MDPVHTTRRARLFLFGIGILFTIMIGYGMYRIYGVESQFTSLKQEFVSFTENKDTLQEAYDTLLEEDHYRYLNLRATQLSKELLTQEYEKFKQGAEGERLALIESVYTQYNAVLEAIERNSTQSLTVSGATDKLDVWEEQFIKQEFEALQEDMTAVKSGLDAEYQQYLATLPTPTPIPTQPPAVAAVGYSYQSVSTGQGTFSAHVIKLPLSQYTVKTLAANDSDCTNNCLAKPLAQYITDNGAYAGIHGSYFCPPDYKDSCSGKTNSYDFAVYDSNSRTWRNEHALEWYDNGLAAFNGAQSMFYEDIQQYFFQHGNGGITAGLSNFPLLLKDGNNVVAQGKVDNYMRSSGTRGAIGADDNNVYLVIASGASVPNMAPIMQALGADHALNLDGGGSAAMYIGGAYKVGPGRLLPNAIVLVKK